MNYRLFLIGGGIGDFLQCLPFVLANKSQNHKYIVSTHFKDARIFFETIRVPILRYYFFTNLEEAAQVVASIKSGPEIVLPCPRTKYFDTIPFATPSPLFDDGKPIIGVHLGGSRHSLETQKRFGVVSKVLLQMLALNLRSDEYNIYLFSSRDEIGELRINEDKDLKIICYDNIILSLSYVLHCAMLVGSDSAFKTMSVMSRVPTIVWLGDYNDNVRDKMFISPYVEDRKMAVIRYRDLGLPDEFSKAINITKDLISRAIASMYSGS